MTVTVTGPVHRATEQSNEWALEGSLQDWLVLCTGIQVVILEKPMPILGAEFI